MMRGFARSSMAGLFSLAMLFLGCLPAAGANFGISPLRAELSPAQRTAALTLRNQGDDAVVVQVQAVSWSQVDGKDVYEPTTELIVTPPIFTVQQGAEQVVRVGLRRAADAQRELSYRIYLQEVPGPPKPGVPGVQMALRIGLPVFVAPAAPAKPELQWRIETAPQGGLRVSAHNAGNMHVQVVDFQLRAPGAEKPVADSEASTYLLAGQRRQWLLKTNAAVTTDRLQIKARTDSGEIQADVVVEQP